ncbi:MAG: DUF4968 domain-containing protein [Ruminococcus sp.]|nr:DUF4968 domain-containing protein [Ruminococcus sp.]
MEEKDTFRQIPGLSREDEEEQLAEIISIAQDNLTKTEEHIRQLSDDLYEIYEQMEEEESEAKQALLLLHNTQSQLRGDERELIRCRKARKKPYFGRIDFKASDQPGEESYYVGRVGISKEDSRPVVIDWRAPIASVYYENVTGSCAYTVHNEKTYEIDLKRKRTYEIEEDRLKDFYDSDVVVNDELLNKYLAKSKNAVLGEIIATIQKEQNAIIRRTPKSNLIVQGVAGSGKTTVAMHRISYILYNFEDEFRSEDFYIIGSNRILLDYITSVLPDLDVYGVSQMTMEELFVRLLYEDWEPKIHRICPIDKKDQGAHIKGCYEWFHDLEQFCKEYENSVIPKEEVRLEKNGALLLDEAAINRYLENNQRVSMQDKINMLTQILLSKLENEIAGKYVSYSPVEKKELQRRYRRHFGRDVWKGSIFEVYQDFLKFQVQKGKNVSFTEHVFDVYDLAALAYLYKRIKETDGIREASHVIIDEAQDFGMMAYGVLEYCLRGCTYTIMGDVSQNIHFGHGLNDWEDLKKLMLGKNFEGFGVLKKSYRNTVEISHFATEILRHGNFSIYPVEPISRHGNEVRVTGCQDEEAMLRETVKIIQGWQKEGHGTIAVICRDESETVTVSRRLGKKISLSGSNLETMEFGNGVMVLPVEYTKGLEFDAVLLYHPSAESYPAKDGYVKLLYVAATRALHELAVVHQGDLTDLIGKQVSHEKRMQSLENEVQKVQKEVVQHGKKEIPAMGDFGKERSVQAADRKEKPESTQRQKRFIPVNESPHQFNECPDNSLMRPMEQGRIDQSIRMIRKRKTCIDLISNYGILRLTPLEDEIIRVQFRRGELADFEPGYWNYKPERPVAWTAKAGKNLVAVDTGTIKVRIDKRTGALRFFDKQGRLLLAEKAEQPRQIESDGGFLARVYFDWLKNEKISVKGILKNELLPMNQKARYISFGGKKLRMPLLVSEYGYGIGIAAEKTVMCCTISTHGAFVHTEGKEQIDYYFLHGEHHEDILGLYQKLI